MHAACMTLLLLCLQPLATSEAARSFDESTAQLLVDAVEAAAALDAYNARCRGDISGRHTDNLNKVLVGQLGTTVLSIQDDFFPERSYRAVQRRLEQDFLTTLRDAGGCQGAKEADLPDQLRRRYDTKLDGLRDLL
jgi:hypothetical protein